MLRQDFYDEHVLWQGEGAEQDTWLFQPVKVGHGCWVPECHVYITVCLACLYSYIKYNIHTIHILKVYTIIYPYVYLYVPYVIYAWFTCLFVYLFTYQCTYIYIYKMWEVERVLLINNRWREPTELWLIQTTDIVGMTKRKKHSTTLFFF